MASPMAAAPAVSRWTRPTLIERMSKSPKAQQFPINHRPDANVSIPLTVGNANLEWHDGAWVNQNIDEQPVNANPSTQEIAQLQKDNAQLQVECEILLHMLTVSEMKKVKAQNRLAELKQRIAELVEQIEADENDI